MGHLFIFVKFKTIFGS